MPEERPLLVDTGSGLTIRYFGRNLYSAVAPKPAAERRAASLEIAPQTLLFVPSPLLFYGIEPLLARLPANVHLLCVEADQKLMRLSIRHAEQSLLHHAKITYLRTDSVEAVLRAFHALEVRSYRRCREITLNGGRSVHRELYAQMFRALEFEIQSHWRNRMTLMHMAHLWIKNFFLNTPQFASGEDLSRLKIGAPIVVAGAGESLEGALPILSSLRREYYLLAVDTALHTLIEYGLRPDAVVVLDAQAWNFQDLIGADTTGIALISDVTAYPGCVRRFHGERWFFFSEFAPLRLFSRARDAGLLPMAIPPLGSVGVAAMYCALAMTAAPVLFAGLDFSYRPGKSHARGAPAHVVSLLRGGRLSPQTMYATTVERPHHEALDKSGVPVWTDNLLSGYSQALDFFISEKTPVYDLGATGLPTKAQVLPDIESVRRVLRIGSAVGEPGGQSGRNAAAQPRDAEWIGDRQHAALRFLHNERTRILSAVQMAIEVLHSGESGTTEPASEGVRRAIHDLDFVYLHFPDWSEDPVPTESFLKRFVEAAESAAVWIEHSLMHFGARPD